MSTTALLLGLCLALCSISSFAQCVQRKEYRDTTDDEWNLFREALLSLQNQPSRQNSGWSEWDDYANFHSAYASYTHNKPMFFPWHRAFLFKLENRLRSLDAKYSNVFIPYWSWSSDWLNPAASPVLTANSGRSLYVPYSNKKRNRRGSQRNPPPPPTRSSSSWWWSWTPTSPPPQVQPPPPQVQPPPPQVQPPPPQVQPPPPQVQPPPPSNNGCLVSCHVPNNHCLKRSYNPNNFPRFYSSDALAQTIIKENGYRGFKNTLEQGSHGQVHVNLGGDTGDLSFMTSPNDPIFFLHHAYIDRMWYIWQQLENGRDSVYDGDLNEQIPGFPGYRVRDMVDYEASCVGYNDYSNDGTLNINSLRARRSSGAEDPVVTAMGDVDDCLPPPLPDAWLIQNGLDPAEVRAVENKMRVTVTKTKASEECAKSSAPTNTIGDNQQPDDNLNSTAPTTQSVTVKSTMNSIPGWGVGLLVLGAAIVVLMGILVVVVMKPRL